MLSTTLSPLVEKLSTLLSAHPDHPVLVALDVTDVPCAVGDTVRLEVRPKYVDSAVPREYR
jgi:hypothetical protein